MENKNYTPEMEQTIRENSPITYDIAVELAENFGKKLRSVIAKACSMDGVEYIARERVNKNGSNIVRKAEIVEGIREYLPGLVHVTKDESGSIIQEGLEKATKEALLAVFEALRKTKPEDWKPTREAHDIR